MTNQLFKNVFPFHKNQKIQIKKREVYLFIYQISK